MCGRLFEIDEGTIAGVSRWVVASGQTEVFMYVKASEVSRISRYLFKMSVIAYCLGKVGCPIHRDLFSMLIWNDVFPTSSDHS